MGNMTIIAHCFFRLHTSIYLYRNDGDIIPVQIDAGVQPEKTMCNNCHVYLKNCSCKKQCKTCLDGYSLESKCNCTKNYIKSLKTRIINDISEEKDVIPVDEQTNISSLIEDRFDAFNLVPPDIGLVVDLTHIGDPKAKELMESLINDDILV